MLTIRSLFVRGLVKRASRVHFANRKGGDQSGGWAITAYGARVLATGRTSEAVAPIGHLVKHGVGSDAST